MTNHKVVIIDFIHNGPQTCFVKFSGFDGDNNNEYEGMVRFVGEMPYGDIIHPTKSELSNDCREFLKDYLLDKYQLGEFNE
ncbi:hypothetical protein JFL43_09910 [Viridibacillus sp. YIM B01967]|uniref:Uncharacterized protein n=1 Tax=Viridibacillus soli TaxID=2798301 RepID=A0ABS1H786_9BACL|nr:hypothetical protein [Viridibacillus soli]MBK3495164.1 hypothetical protein [Viridibacillus soli]